MKKSEYQIYHRTYSSSIDAMIDYANRNNYSINQDELFDTVSIGPIRPREGVTNRFTLSLFKDDKEQRKAIHFQVYGRGNAGFELNMYIS
jgi:hypothetical protein